MDLTEDQRVRLAILDFGFDATRDLVQETVPDSREKNLAFKRIEQCHNDCIDAIVEEPTR